MFLQKTLLILLSLLLCATTAYSSDKVQQTKQKPDLLWYRAYFPPVTIPHGEDAGTGFYDRINGFLISHLPQYKHTFVTANYQRIAYELKNNNRGCCAALYKTVEREKFTAFSVPVVLVLPNGIIVHKKNKELFSTHLDKDGKLSLISLLNDESLHLGIAKGRKYSGGIDEILSAHAGKINIIERSGNDVFLGLLEMLLMDRVEYILGYPTEAKYLAARMGKQSDIFFYPVAETDVEFTLGHVGCPDTPWGRAIIQEIDKILLENRANPDFISYYTDWLDSETAGKYSSMAREFFRNEQRDQR